MADDLIDASFYQALIGSGLDHTHTFGWSTTSTALDPLENFLMSESTPGVQRAAARVGDSFVSIELTSDGHVWGRVVGTYDGTHATLARLKELLPPSEEEQYQLPYMFWRSMPA